MTIYAFILTAVSCTALGIVIHATFEEYMDARVRKLRRKARQKARALNSKKSESDAMDEAVALVKDRLGGEVIAIEHHTS